MSDTEVAYRPEGTVYGVLLNFQREHALWAPRMDEAPYKGAPKAPVLYVKTANTFAPSGTAIALPRSATEAELGASLGLVIGGDPRSGSSPLDAVRGVVLMNDLSLPHASYYRPPVRFKCPDGFLGVGPRCVPLDRAGNLPDLELTVRVDGEVVQTVDLRTLVRDAAQLLADVSEFMRLLPGDVLMLGTDCRPDGTRPRVRAGATFEISAPGFEPLVNTLVGASA